MKPARLLDDAIYGDYPALYALGVETPVTVKAPRRQRGWVVAIGAMGAALTAVAVAAAIYAA